MIRLISFCASVFASVATGVLFFHQRVEIRASLKTFPVVGLLVFLALLAFGCVASAVAIVMLDEFIAECWEARATREQEERKHERIKAGVWTSAQFAKERGASWKGHCSPVLYAEVDRKRREILIRRARSQFVDVRLD